MSSEVPRLARLGRGEFCSYWACHLISEVLCLVPFLSFLAWLLYSGGIGTLASPEEAQL